MTDTQRHDRGWRRRPGTVLPHTPAHTRHALRPYTCGAWACMSQCMSMAPSTCDNSAYHDRVYEIRGFASGCTVSTATSGNAPYSHSRHATSRLIHLAPQALDNTKPRVTISNQEEKLMTDIESDARSQINEKGGSDA